MRTQKRKWLEQIRKEFCFVVFLQCFRLKSCEIKNVALQRSVRYAAVIFLVCRKFNNCSVRDVPVCIVCGTVECRFTPVPHCAKISLNTVLHDTLKVLYMKPVHSF